MTDTREAVGRIVTVLRETNVRDPWFVLSQREAERHLEEHIESELARLREALASAEGHANMEAQKYTEACISNGQLREALAVAERERDEAIAKYEGSMTLGHDCGFNAAIILSEHREEGLRAELAAAESRASAAEGLLKECGEVLGDVVTAMTIASAIEAVAAEYDFGEANDRARAALSRIREHMQEQDHE